MLVIHFFLYLLISKTSFLSMRHRIVKSLMFSFHILFHFIFEIIIWLLYLSPHIPPYKLTHLCLFAILQFHCLFFFTGCYSMYICIYSSSICGPKYNCLYKVTCIFIFRGGHLFPRICPLSYPRIFLVAYSPLCRLFLYTLAVMLLRLYVCFFWYY